MDKSAGYFARESALIVFSILVALGVNEWRTRAGANAEKREAYAAVYAELVDNLEILEGMPAYHQSVAEALTAAIDRLDENAAATPIEVFSGLEGLRPAIIIDRHPQYVSWELAKQRGAAARFDYETARSLSIIYDSQTNSVLPLFSKIADLLARPEMYVANNQTASLSPIAGQFAELASREYTLVFYLKRQIETMRAENPKLETTREK